jgi:predicted dehydrogenase
VLAAAAAPWLVPAGVIRAQDGKPVPSGRTTFGLIGCGNMGPEGMKNVLNDKTAQVIGTCDVFRNRANRWRDNVDKHYKAKGCTAYYDFRELLARKDLDCVEIATGDYWHIPLALAAIRAGKDTYVEKPLGVSLEWAKVLRDEIVKRKAVFQFGTWQRSRTHFRRACELVRDGAIGKVSRVDAWSYGLASDGGGIFNPRSHVRKLHLAKPADKVPADLNYDLWLGPAPQKAYSNARVSTLGIYHIYDYAIGYIGGWGIHPVDIAQWALDADLAPPVSYKGTGRLPDAGLFDTVAAWDVLCKYENGVEMRFMDHTAAAPVVKKYLPRVGDHGTTFHGEKGWISVSRSSVQSSDAELVKRSRRKPADGETHLYASEGNNQWQNFIACVKSRKPTINPIQSAFNGDVICHLTDLVVRTGRELKWDAKTETIVNDAGANALLNRPLREPWKL